MEGQLCVSSELRRKARRSKYSDGLPKSNKARGSSRERRKKKMSFVISENRKDGKVARYVLLNSLLQEIR